MKLNQMKISLVLIVVFVLASTILIPGCKNEEVPDSQLQTRTASIVNNSESLAYIARYTWLTYSHYQDIIADNYSISTIAIEYAAHKNYDQYNSPQEVTGLALNSNIGRNGGLFSSHSIYKGDYQYYNLVGGGFDKLHLRRTFLSSEVNDLIFDYLEEGDNEDYFFNGNEYTDNNLPIPYEHEGGPFGEGDNWVIISFREPGTVYDRWGISKSMFADDPHPILQGLIDILEDDFITQFE